MTIHGPLLKSSETTSRIMWSIAIALLPSLLVTAYYQGISSTIPVIICVASALLFEAIWMVVLCKPLSLEDGSAAVTGLLLAATLPPTIAWYLCILATAVAVIIGKLIFGGLGRNVFNPALLGRAAVFILFPLAFAQYVLPTGAIDALSAATPLAAMKQGLLETVANTAGGRLELYTQLFLGNHGGSIGETSVLALLIGGIFLLWRGYISWRIPVSFIMSVGVFGYLFGGTSGAHGDGLVHILSGGTMLGAFFIATDYVTSPMLPKAKIAFGVLCGVLTIAIRRFTAMPEGVMYAILLLNPIAPLFDRIEQQFSNQQPFKRAITRIFLTKNSTLSKRIKSIITFLLFIGLLLQLSLPVIQSELAKKREKTLHIEKLSTVLNDFFPDKTKKQTSLWNHHDEPLMVFTVFDGGSVTGYAAESCGMGYGGKIRVLVAMDTTFLVKGVSVISHNETKNLGSKITQDVFLEQFVGRSAEKLTVTKGDSKSVQAITAATISSKAVTEDAVKSAVAMIKSNYSHKSHYE